MDHVRFHSRHPYRASAGAKKTVELGSVVLVLKHVLPHLQQHHLYRNEKINL